MCWQFKEEQQTEWCGYTFAADGSWAQSGQTATCRGPRTRIRVAVKLERQLIYKQVQWKWQTASLTKRRARQQSWFKVEPKKHESRQYVHDKVYKQFKWDIKIHGGAMVTYCQSHREQSETAEQDQSRTMKQESRRGVHVIYLCKCVNVPGYRDAWMLILGAALRHEIKHCNICRLFCADAIAVKRA